MILLIGNFLSKHGLNPTAIEDLAVSLSNRHKIRTASCKKNPIIRLSDMVIAVLASRKVCKLIIVDVFSTNAFIFSFVVISLAQLFNIPYVPIFRGGYLVEKYKKHPKIFKYLFARAEIIACPSTYYYDYFKPLFFPVRLIPNYIDMQNYKFKERAKLKPNLLWVRSIHKIYNPIMAIIVLDRVKQNYPDAQLCIVGPVKDVNMMEKLEAKITHLKLLDNILFTGKLSKKEWTEFSQKYDIFINTSNIDNTPVTLMEAMALGLPIVSTNVGGIPSLIDDGVTGLLIEPNDSDQMAEKINELTSGKIDGDYITRNARERISIMDKKEVIKQWYDIIDDTFLQIK